MRRAPRFQGAESLLCKPQHCRRETCEADRFISAHWRRIQLKAVSIETAEHQTSGSKLMLQLDLLWKVGTLRDIRNGCSLVKH